MKYGIFNLGFIGVWALSRTAGLPVGPNAGIAESASLVDLTVVGFQAALIGQIARIEGEGPKVLTYTALMAGAGNIVSFTFPLMFWTVALFRADRAPELVALANDLAWMPFLGMISPFIPLPFCV